MVGLIQAIDAILRRRKVKKLIDRVQLEMHWVNAYSGLPEDQKEKLNYEMLKKLRALYLEIGIEI